MKINEQFEFDMFRFLHRPLRTEDTKNDNFLELYMKGMQQVWETTNQKILGAQGLNNPSTCPADSLKYLKDIVGFTVELDYITQSLSENDLRKVILLGVPLWKTKGLEQGFKTIIKLFTGFDARVFTWFDYRMIVGEKAIGEEQLGEDAWVISLPGQEQRDVVGDVFLLLQFDDKTLKDVSPHNHKIEGFGTYLFEDGGAIGQSDYYPVGLDWCLKSAYRNVFNFEQGLTFECYFKTEDNTQTIPLLHNWNSVLGKGVKLVVDTSTNEIVWSIGDGIRTQVQTVASGITMADGNWHHLAWVIDFHLEEPILDDMSSVWVDGTRVDFLEILNTITISELKSDEPLFIGSDYEYGTRFSGGLDMVRLTGDPRYNTDLSTITVPAINFVEYRKEELDEFLIVIRVVDDGTLDRQQLKRIINLMRPVGERVHIAYMDFYDEFEGGKGKLSTQFGGAYVELTDFIYYVKMPPVSLEHVNVTGSDDWQDYTAQLRCCIYEGTEIEVRWLIQDVDNYYAFRLNSVTKYATLHSVVGGVSTQLAPPVLVDLESANPELFYSFYIFTVSCFKDKDDGNTTIRAFLDQNRVFEVNDTNFYKGTFGLYSPAGSTVWCSEMEMFQLPLETDVIRPNDKF